MSTSWSLWNWRLYNYFISHWATLSKILQRMQIKMINIPPIELLNNIQIYGEEKLCCNPASFSQWCHNMMKSPKYTRPALYNEYQYNVWCLQSSDVYVADEIFLIPNASWFRGMLSTATMISSDENWCQWLETLHHQDFIVPKLS